MAVITWCELVEGGWSPIRWSLGKQGSEPPFHDPYPPTPRPGRLLTFPTPHSCLSGFLLFHSSSFVPGKMLHKLSKGWESERCLSDGLSFEFVQSTPAGLSPIWAWKQKGADLRLDAVEWRRFGLGWRWIPQVPPPPPP